MVLVDTSVWIEYLDRNNELVEKDLDELLRRCEVAVSGLVLAELRHGCKTIAQVDLLLKAMEPLHYLEADRSHWLQAGEIAAAGVARGHQLEIADCLLAALTLRENCSVFTLDRNFERIPRLKLYRPRVS